jgi:spore coat polysaccharide biosynthesis predicted glycosyltransferase SpsG/RimJ/RimL family protein N-acetyltransferase
MLRVNFNVTYFCINIPDPLGDEIKKNGYNLILIEQESDFLKIIQKQHIIVLDGYHFDSEYQKLIKKTGAGLICIDDLCEGEFYADLIINHAPNIPESRYKRQANTSLGLGLEFALLRPLFLEQAQRKRRIDKIETVLVCFGGSDYKNLTLSTLEILCAYDQFSKIIVITGISYSSLDTLHDILNSDNRLEHRQSLNEKQMLDSFLEADLAIVSSSGILFEAISAGCSVISGTYAYNQKFLYENFLNAGYIYDGFDFSPEFLKRAINCALHAGCNNSNPIDGKSNKRILCKIFETFTTIREVSWNDAEQLFIWANDPDVRRNAVNNEPIVWNNHIKWLSKKLTSADTKIFILEFQGIPVGQIRFDKNDSGQWVIDYSVEAEYRGAGLGKILLSRTMNLFTDAVFLAYVNQKNLASIKVFIFFNFIKVRQETIGSEIYDVLEKKTWKI